MKRGKSTTVLGFTAEARQQFNLLAPASLQVELKGPGKPGRGFSLVELMVTISLFGTLLMLAIPSYTDAVNKRRMSQAAEQIVSFLNLTQSEAMKRSKPMVISYSKAESGAWCLGARLGTNACDCMEATPASSNYCAIESSPWILGDAHMDLKNLVKTSTSDGSFVIDPGRGLVRDTETGFADTFQLGLQADEKKFRMTITLIKTGKVSACVPADSQPIGGFNSCPQDS